MIKLWLVGLFFSVGVGAAITPLFQGCIDMYARLPQIRYAKGAVRNISPEVTGFIERVLFTCLIGLNVPEALTAMIAWTAAKMAANWNSAEVTNMKVTPREIITRRFSALLTGVVSLVIATTGGAIWNGTIPPERWLLWTGVALFIAGLVARGILSHYRPTVVVGE